MDRWLSRRPNAAASHRLFCFPYAGGGVHTFMSWQSELGDSVEICAIQLPGRGSRLLEPACLAFEPLIDNLVRVVANEADRPFSLYGHSLGALVAFEVARRLEILAVPEFEHLIVSGCEAPQCRSRPEPLHEYSDERLIDALSKLNGTPEEVLRDSELMQLLLPIIRADFELSTSYQYSVGRPLGVPITVCAGLDDHHVEQTQIDSWCALTERTCAVHWLAGDHFFIDRSRAELMKLLRPLVLAIPRAAVQSGLRHTEANDGLAAEVPRSISTYVGK